VNGDIEVEVGAGPEPGTYRVQVLHSAAGGRPSSAFSLDPDLVLGRRDDLENAVLASAVARRGLTTAAEAPIREVGRNLFEALFTGSVGGAYRASQGAVQQRQKRLRIVLHLTSPELTTLPWETLYDPETGAYVCRTEPLVRHVDAPYTPEALEVRPPLHILGLVASPQGFAPLDVDAEQRHLSEALAKPIADGLVDLTWARDASWDTIHELMLGGTWHILHFVGHGDYDVTNDQGVLALVDARGRADLVEASQFTDLLSEAEPSPPLMVLNSCSSGASGMQDLFSGTAAALVHGGISAVAAMQFSISDTAAIKFARGFYAAFACGRTVDEAVRSGRIGILGTAHSLEWLTPVLYVRGGASHLFTLTSEPTACRPPEAGTDMDMPWAGPSPVPPAPPSAPVAPPSVPPAPPPPPPMPPRRAAAATWPPAEAAGPAPAWDGQRAAVAYLDAPRATVFFNHQVYRVAWHPRRDRLAVAGKNPSIGIYDATGRKECSIKAGSLWSNVLSVAFNPADDTVAADSVNNTARIWETDTGRRLGEVRHAGAVWSVAFSPDGRLLATGGSDGTAGVWEPRTSRRLAEVKHDQGIWSVAFSPDGRLLATGSADHTVRLWDEAGRRRFEARHADIVWSVAFSPDGTCLATGSADRAARLWDTSTSGRLREISHPDAVLSVAFSPDGRLLATGSQDGKARVWDSDSGRQLIEARHRDAVLSVAFNSDGRLLATGSADRTARIWDIGTPTPG